MTGKISIGIITGYGINAEMELCHSFEIAHRNISTEYDLEIQLCHINDVFIDPEKIMRFHILAFPGGFSFGDHIGSGKVLAHLIKMRLKNQLNKFIENKKLIIGICNGFQVLIKMGIIPNVEGDWKGEASLIHNEEGNFIDSWVQVNFNTDSVCVWTQDLKEMELPIRHGEGKFVVIDDSILHALNDFNLVALRYRNNPNGSTENIAGITDTTGQILGLMPHPEAFWMPYNHPRWNRERITEGLGLKIFENGLKYVAKYIL
jgi:phosphoribosylformylglycinamidine synthase subunit PurQ / glutaminase